MLLLIHLLFFLLLLLYFFLRVFDFDFLLGSSLESEFLFRDCLVLGGLEKIVKITLLCLVGSEHFGGNDINIRGNIVSQGYEFSMDVVKVLG
jgi:hypothetical protein